jgi:hypothetical protein
MIDRWAIDFTEATALGQFRHVERDGHHYLALRDDVRADGATLADAWADMADQLAQMWAVSAAETEAADARAKAGWSEMMTAEQAVKRYGDRLVGEYVAVQVWAVDSNCPQDLPLEIQYAWLGSEQQVHVLNVPEGGQNALG